MRKTSLLLWLCAVLGLGTGLAPAQAAPASPESPPAAIAQALNADETRWREAFDAFAEADRTRAPAPGSVLFVGSSSIRLWDDLEGQFDGATIVKRGFGGSRMSDCRQHLARLVLPYKPRLIVVYAGDNDLAEGRSPEQVAADFGAFVDGVRARLPDARIAYLSIKPSPSRQHLLPAVRQANALIAAYSRSTANLDYIDVYSPMLDANGAPRSELFGGDHLHLNSAGYALWKTVIAGHLR